MTAGQGSLFDPPPAPSPYDRAEELRTITGHAHPDTSYAAAARILPRSGTQRRAVLDHVTACGEYGATDDEVVTALGLNPNAVRPRRVELADLGLIRRTGTQRRNARGFLCDVWAVVPHE